MTTVIYRSKSLLVPTVSEGEPRTNLTGNMMAGRRAAGRQRADRHRTRAVAERLHLIHK